MGFVSLIVIAGVEKKKEKNSVTRKMVPITWRASSLLEIIVCTIRALSFQKQNRKKEETEPQT